MDIVVIGLGRIGLVAACCLSKSGHTVLGVEIDAGKLETIRKGKPPFFEPELEDLLKYQAAAGRLSFAQELPDKIDADVIIIAVNSPRAADGSADLTEVETAVRAAAHRLVQPVAMVMKSTVPPGTGIRLIENYLREKPVAYVSNPEFLRTGQSVKDWYKTSRIVAGFSDHSALKTMQKMYHDIDAPWVATSITSAEMLKYAANCFLATKISFINDIANLCDLVEADIDDVVRGIGLDPRIGTSYLQPGAGYGGSCLPKDVQALIKLSESQGYKFKTLRAVVEANKRQREIVVGKLRGALRHLQGKEIAVLGLAFKPGTDDMGDAPSLYIVKKLVAGGSKVRVYDPAAMDNGHRLLPLRISYADDIYSATKNAHAVLLLTEWPPFIEADWTKIRRDMQDPYVLVDARNALPPDTVREYGFKYTGIGRGNA